MNHIGVPQSNSYKIIYIKLAATPTTGFKKFPRDPELQNAEIVAMEPLAVEDIITVDNLTPVAQADWVNMHLTMARAKNAQTKPYDKVPLRKMSAESNEMRAPYTFAPGSRFTWESSGVEVLNVTGLGGNEIIAFGVSYNTNQ